MKRIPLTKGQFAIVDDAEYDWLNQWKWHAYESKGDYYACTQIGGMQIAMHRLLLDTPKGMETDHRNHNSLDNRIENLRVCTTAENQHNGKLRKDNKSGYKGVHWHSKDKRWRAQIRHNGIRIFIGNYVDKILAAKAYDEKPKELFGEFACLNF